MNNCNFVTALELSRLSARLTLQYLENLSNALKIAGQNEAGVPWRSSDESSGNFCGGRDFPIHIGMRKFISTALLLSHCISLMENNFTNKQIWPINQKHKNVLDEASESHHSDEN